jgi:hypothetical protein
LTDRLVSLDVATRAGRSNMGTLRVRALASAVGLAVRAQAAHDIERAVRRCANISCVARRRHLDKDIEGVLLEAEAHGWVVVPSANYWKLRCKCPAKHQRWVHLTPSNTNYGKNLASWLKRQSCW